LELKYNSITETKLFHKFLNNLVDEVNTNPEIRSKLPNLNESANPEIKSKLPNVNESANPEIPNLNESLSSINNSKTYKRKFKVYESVKVGDWVCKDCGNTN